jgi:hypothetical protein
MTTLEGARADLRAQLIDLDTEHDKLQQELNELALKRERIAFTLSVLDDIETPASAGAIREGEAARRPVAMKAARRRLGGTTEYILKALEALGVPAAVEHQMIPAMREQGWTAQPVNAVETVRAALSRATRDGLVVRVGTGLYGLPEWSTGISDGEQAQPDDDAAETDADTDDLPPPVEF